MSRYHFDPDLDEQSVMYGHSMGVIAKLFYDVAKTFGEVHYIDSTDTTVKGGEYDLLVSLPRNFDFLTKNNQFRKTACYLNIAESKYIKKTLVEEAQKLGCKLSDCYSPLRYYHADLYFMLGGDFNRKHFVAAGIPTEKIIDINYGMDLIPFKSRLKNYPPIFLHIATTMGLRKGFYHAVKDFQKANLAGAELWCVGRVQNEKFWTNFAREAGTDPQITIYGWIPCNNPRYLEILYGSDFIVFPSFAEGQGGTLMEGIAAGCVPIVTEESAFPHYPIGKYVRGDTAIWKRAHAMSNEDFKQAQLEMQDLLKTKYNNEIFKQIIKSELEKLIQ